MSYFRIGFDDVSFGVRSIRLQRNRLFDVSDSFRQSGNFQLFHSSVSTEQLVMSTDSEGSASSPTFPTGLIRCLEPAVDDSVFMVAVGGRPVFFSPFPSVS